MKLLKRGFRYLLIAVACYALLVVFIGVGQFIAAKRGPVAEAAFNPKAPIDPTVMQIIETARKLVNVNRTPSYHRDVHSKPHGCVRARFEIPSLDERFRHGVFAKPGEYEAWLRFSNGATPSPNDQVDDARGMAIKLMGVQGEKLLPLEQHAQTQDFIMINTPSFFIQTVEQYGQFMKHLSKGDKYGYFFGGPSINPFKWHIRQLFLAKKTLSKPPTSPLNAQFFSLSPYKLGPNLNIKYSARPCEVYNPVGIDESEPNFLRNAMKRTLRDQSGCFDFMVQVQQPDKYMPIEDTTVEWKEEDSPFVALARIYIPPQEFDTAEQNEFCEDLSYTVWHTLDAHRPISAINRLRKDVYAETAAYRRTKNGAPLHEPLGWCLKLDGEVCEAE